MNGGSWPTKCSSGWSPAPPEAAISAPSQLQMGMNSNLPSHFPILQELPGFNDLNPAYCQPRTELTILPLPLLSGKYPHLQSSSLDRVNSNNALQVITPVASVHPFLERNGKEVQNQVLQFSKAGQTQNAYRIKTLDFRASQKAPINSLMSSGHGDQRLVFCMNTVGELIFADSGHLGVVCFCHRSKMSVAKFCEHSGGISNNAGESVYMENGMPISFWARFFLGVHSTQWDWPSNSSLQATVIQSSSLDGSLGRSNNRTVYQNQPSTVAPTTSVASTAPNRNLNEYHNALSPNHTSAAQKGKFSTSIPNNGFRLVSASANGSNFTGERITLGNNARNGEDFASPPPSRFELKLGQPPNLINNSTKAVIPTSTQLTTVIDAQESHFSQLAVNKDFSSHETSGTWQNPQKEDSHLNQPPVNTVPLSTNPPSTLTSDDLTAEPTKNSLISLFLSHLERTNPPSGDDIFGNYITDSVRASDEKASDPCRNGFLRVCDGNSSLSSNLDLSRAGGFLCNVGHAVRASSPNPESISLKQHNFEIMENSCHESERRARFCETVHQQGRMCCLANLKFENSCSQDHNNKALHEELVQKFQCVNHGDVCKFPVRSIPSCLVCSREQSSACHSCGIDKPPSSSNSHENLPTCGAHCISRCSKRAISWLKEGKEYLVGDTNKRPKLLSQCECSWKDVPGNNFLGEKFPIKDIPERAVSSISSGLSAPAVTEVSVETDRNCEVGPISMSVVPVPDDEASLVEKCGSSDENHEFCTTIRTSLSGTNKSSCLKRGRLMPTDSLAKKLPKNGRPVRRCKKPADLVYNEPLNHSETNKTFTMKNGKDKLLDQAHHGAVGRPGMSKTYAEKKRKEKSVYLVHNRPVKCPEMNETFSKKKKEDNLVDQVHNGPMTCSETTEEMPVALVHRRPVSFFKANVTFSEKNSEDEVDPVHHGPTNCVEARKQPKYKYLSDVGIEESETKKKNNSRPFCAKRNKPVVCGDFGIISNGMTNDALKPVKIVSLVSILRRTKTNSDEILQNKFGKSSFLARDRPGLCDLKKSKGLVGNNLKNEVVMLKPTLSQLAPRCKNIKSNEFEESSGKIKRAKMKSIWLDVMEREGEAKSEHSAKNGAELVQEESNNAVTFDPLLSSSEYQSFPAVQGSKPRHTEADKHIFLSALSCSVCQRSTEEDFNKILRCQHCTIMVHQACYGISKLPKGPWFCRPCRAGSLDPVCVLCGYQGGAMTRAQKPRKLINSLIKYFHELGNDRQITQLIAADENRSMMHWVHMVCCLWNPGTRCPNVYTMAAFDVSGTSLSRKNSVCSVCRRPGGSCIKCRVSGCTIVFHPWCAHQQGLLQSEVEGEHSEKVGFYGRCAYHAMGNKSARENSHFEAKKNDVSNENWTCARTEVFKGRKREQCANPTFDDNVQKGGLRDCMVSEEQINAWVRINSQKPCMTNMAVKPCSSSAVELDLQKEYVRYKQSKGWKHLVVYKSGIHELGVYTSCFIPRDAMVVEYVGEIVGLKVADKRERDCQSGQNLHSKSACYLFCIDKENIIDATRKGSIARFINHSCSPNCVAKIILVSNEKKVVFIAERDINPGEEITYDYNFNREDDGEKIPCFCNSKNCRRYLN